MSLQQLLILTAAAMLVVLAVTRVVREHLGRAAHPAGKARLPFIVAFLLLPPVVVEVAVLRPTTSAAQLHLIESVLVYLAALAVFSTLMGIAALLVHVFIHGRARRPLQIALVGSETETDSLPFDPALTPALAESVSRVDAANRAFPRGAGFPAEVDRADFRAAWDALDAATGSLEAQIADSKRLGMAVSATAVATARDARGRLDSLRRLSVDQGRAWAS